MKTIIVHLSDIHMDSNWNYEDFVQQLTYQICNYDIKDVFIVISGDLTQSADKEQYERVYGFVESISNILSSKSIKSKFVFVPGNHDIKYLDGEKRNRDVLKKISDTKYFDGFDSEISRFDNFYSFCELFDLPNECLNGNKFAFQHVDFMLSSQLNMRFYLVNNVMFSTYKDVNDEDSNGVAYVPPKLFESIKMEPGYINILVMHFPIHYLSETSYEGLKKAMPNLNYVLCGHVHRDENINIHSKDNLCPISISPALYRENVERLGMSVLLIDEEERQIKRFSYFLSEKNELIASNDVQSSSLRLIRGVNPLMIDDKFQSSILYSGYESIPLDYYFVFPEMVSRKNESLKKISDEEHFLSLINKNKYVIISGSSQSGKTTFLNKMFFDLCSIGIPLIINMEEHFFSTEDAFKQIIDSKLISEYDDDYSLQIFYSKNIEERIALLDNFVINKDSKQVLDIVFKFFGKVIITTSGTDYGTTKLENIAINSLMNDSIVVYEIEPMFNQKRYELVEKRYSSLLKKRGRAIEESEVKIFYQKVQMILDKYVGSDANYPYFINKVVTSIIKDE